MSGKARHCGKYVLLSAGDESATRNHLNLTVIDAMYGTVRRVDELQVTSSSAHGKTQVLQVSSFYMQICLNKDFLKAKFQATNGWLGPFWTEQV